MNDDDLIRAGLLTICLIFMPIALYHRIRSYTGEKMDRWQEGVIIFLGLRLIGMAMFAAGLTWLIDPRWLAWSAFSLPLWMRTGGLVLAACAGSLFVWAVHHLGKNLSVTVVTRREHALVNSGPYRWVRHPFYSACLLAVVGTSLTMANWFPLAAGSVGMILLIARTRTEEANLVKRFGDDYREMMARTGRFLPRLRSRRGLDNQ